MGGQLCEAVNCGKSIWGQLPPWLHRPAPCHFATPPALPQATSTPLVAAAARPCWLQPQRGRQCACVRVSASAATCWRQRPATRQTTARRRLRCRGCRRAGRRPSLLPRRRRRGARRRQCTRVPAAPGGRCVEGKRERARLLRRCGTLRGRRAARTKGWPGKVACCLTAFSKSRSAAGNGAARARIPEARGQGGAWLVSLSTGDVHTANPSRGVASRGIMPRARGKEGRAAPTCASPSIAAQTASSPGSASVTPSVAMSSSASSPGARVTLVTAGSGVSSRSGCLNAKSPRALGCTRGGWGRGARAGAGVSSA